MYVRIGTFDAPPAQRERLLALFRGPVFDAFSRLDGFVGYDAYVDPTSGRFVGISKWVSREALLASGETGRHARQQAEALGARWIGEPQILEAAFQQRR
jgi:quinol monooxygenase YgiN